VRVTKDNAKDFGYTLDDDGTLTFLGKPTGESMDLSISGVYTQDSKTKKVLDKYWNVPLTEYYEKNISAGITIQAVDLLSNAQTVSAKKSDPKILANILSAAPGYFLFLLRIVLTIFVILATVRVIFSITPRTYGQK
jgi:hypothetical protein